MNGQPEQQIVVRDRRATHQYSIHNQVMDEWLPIIGLHGYAIYSLYVRMANQADERSFPGYTLIEKHLGIGRSTISRYNQLLSICGLIHIEPGDSLSPNQYFILDIPRVSTPLLKTLAARIRTEINDHKFVGTVLARIEDWHPIQDHWRSSERERTIVVCSAQGSPVAEHPSPAAEQGSPVAEHPSPVAEQGVPLQDSNNPKQQSEITIRNNNPKTTAAAAATITVTTDGTLAIRHVEPSNAAAALLDDFNIDPSIVHPESVDPVLARAWMLYAWVQPGLRHPNRYVAQRLRQGKEKPPRRFLRWAQLTPDEWRSLWRAHRYGETDALPPDLDLDTWERDFGDVFPDGGPFDDEPAPGAVEPTQKQEKDIWQVALDDLRLQMTQATFDTWLRDSRLLRCEDGVLIVGVKSAYAKDWLENRLLTTVECTLRRMTGRSVEVRFEVIGGI